MAEHSIATEPYEFPYSMTFTSDTSQFKYCGNHTELKDSEKYTKMENYGHILVSHIQTQIPSSIKMVLRFHIHVFYQYTHLERLYLKHKRDQFRN